MSVEEHDLPWVGLWQRRCAAVREQRPGALYWGQCEFRRNHGGDHALDRGVDVVRWSSDWTQHPAARVERVS